MAVEFGPERSLGIARSAIVGEDVVTTMATGPWLNGPAGIPPGGVLGVVVDDVLGFAIARTRGAGHWTVSAEISLDLTGPVPADGSRIEASARSVHSGPHGGLGSGTVRDAAGNLIALCRQHGRWVTTLPPEVPVPDDVTGAVPAESLLADSLPAKPLPAKPLPAGSPPAGSVPVPPPTWSPRADWVPPASLEALLGARVQPTEGGAVLELDVTNDLRNPLGNLHGGITIAACDLAAQAALHAAGGPAQTASIHVSYPRPVPLGATPRFEARIVHRGRSLGIVGVTATVDGRKPCIVATITTTARTTPL